jgi:hypothetical protein
VKRIDAVFSICLLALPAMAVGGVHAETAAVFAAVVWTLWGVQAWFCDGADGIEVSIPSLAFWLFGITCALQLIPLPGGLHWFLSPESAQIYQESRAALMGDANAASYWRPLSLHVDRTAISGLRWLGLGMFCVLIAYRRRGDRRWRDTLTYAVVALGLVMVAGFIQTGFGASNILFVYEPSASIQRFSTFVSPNHGAIFFGVASLVGLALAVRSFPDSRRRMTVGLIVGVGALVTLFEQGSVGATFGYLVGLCVLTIAVFGTLGPRHGSRQSKYFRRIVWILLVVVVAFPVIFGMAWWLAPEWTEAILAGTRAGDWIHSKAGTRLELIDAGTRLVAAFPVFGIGAGATGDVLPMYVDWGTVPPAEIPTIEMETLEWLFEFGLPVGVTGCILLSSYLVYLGRAVQRSSRLRYHLGFAIALLMAINTQFHFPWLSLGIAVPVLFVVETTSGLAAQKTVADGGMFRRGMLTIPKRLERFVWFGAGIVGLACVVAGFSAPENAQRPLSEPELQNALNRRPASHQLFVQVAEQRIQKEEQDAAKRTIQRAYELNPHARMELRRAEFMMRAGDQKAAVSGIERLFEPGRYKLPEATLSDWVERFIVPSLRTPQRLAAALSKAPGRFKKTAVEALRRQGGGGRGLELAMAFADQHPDSFEAYRMVVESALSLDRPVLAELWARRMINHGITAPSTSTNDPQTLLARALRAAGNDFEARQVALKHVQKTNEIPLQLGMLVISLSPTNPADSDKPWVGIVKKTLHQLCKSPEMRWTRRRCWLGRAWLDERQAKFSAAEHSYLRISRQSGKFGRAAKFYRRTDQCVKLNKRIDEWKARGVVSDEQGSRLENIAADCPDSTSNDTPTR